MDIKRRNFFKNFGGKTVAVAAVVTAPVLAKINVFNGQVQTLHSRLDSVFITSSYQQIQLYFIFLLLVISFAIDAGISFILIFSWAS